jgi:hypothetical protein
LKLKAKNNIYATASKLLKRNIPTQIAEPIIWQIKILTKKDV